MPSPTIMRATMRRYIELVGKNDVDGVLALFTEDVSVED
ncbi:MAG: steroid delta-isomerase, partial [Deltaproteobacteria bacterium]|nr:steroid delta-isomerase [Deltaproteobacteria bacterium]